MHCSQTHDVLWSIRFFRRTRLNDRVYRLMSEIIFLMLLSCVIYFLVCLFSLDQVEEIDSTIRLRILAPMPVLLITYIYCYFSEMVTEKSSAIAETTYDSMWYTMPAKRQRAIVMILIQSQREFRLQGVGMLDCSFRIYLTVSEAVALGHHKYFLIREILPF